MKYRFTIVITIICLPVCQTVSFILGDVYNLNDHSLSVQTIVIYGISFAVSCVFNSAILTHLMFYALTVSLVRCTLSVLFL